MTADTEHHPAPTGPRPGRIRTAITVACMLAGVAVVAVAAGLIGLDARTGGPGENTARALGIAVGGIDVIYLGLGLLARWHGRR